MAIRRFGQPAPPDHPWRTMPFNGMMPHILGSSLSAQVRYAAGTLKILESYFRGTPIREEYLIVDARSWRDREPGRQRTWLLPRIRQAAPQTLIVPSR